MKSNNEVNAVGRHFIDESGAQPVDPVPKPSLLRQLWSFFAPTIICCALVIVINTFFLFYAVVPTGSMKNLIQEHSFILANRLAYTSSDVQRGDVIVFAHPDPDDPKVRYLVKRVVAVAGDTVELRDGQLIRNGAVVDESAYVLGETFAHNQRTYTVPEGCVLVFGDNRVFSKDARYWDDPYLSVEAIRGKVFCSFSIRHHYFRWIS